MESEADDDLVAFIDEFCAAPPSQLLNNEPTKDISAANLLLFAIECLADQMRKPMCLQAFALHTALVYKQNAPQRHQKYWSFFRSLGRAMQKYNNSTLLKKLALVQKKCVPTGGETYTVSQNFLRYVGCAYIRRLFYLSKIKEYCLKTAHSSMGYLELGHWQNLTLVIVALCSEIHSHVRREAEFMAKAFQRISKYLVQIDSRFPERLEELEVFKKLTEELSSQGKSLEVATSLLKFSEEHMKKAQDQMEMEQFKKEILDDLLIESKPSQALGVAVKRDEHPFPMDFQSPGTSTQTPKPSKEPRKEALSKSKKIDLDFFLSDDFNFKTPGRSEESKESDLLSPNLFGSLKRKNEAAKKDSEIDRKPDLLSPNFLGSSKKKNEGYDTEKGPPKGSGTDKKTDVLSPNLFGKKSVLKVEKSSRSTDSPGSSDPRKDGKNSDGLDLLSPNLFGSLKRRSEDQAKNGPTLHSSDDSEAEKKFDLLSPNLFGNIKRKMSSPDSLKTGNQESDPLKKKKKLKKKKPVEELSVVEPVKKVKKKLKKMKVVEEVSIVGESEKITKKKKRKILEKREMTQMGTSVQSFERTENSSVEIKKKKKRKTKKIKAKL